MFTPKVKNAYRARVVGEAITTAPEKNVLDRQKLELEIRSKEQQIKGLEARIREARGYIGSLRRRLEDRAKDKKISRVEGSIIARTQ